MVRSWRRVFAVLVACTSLASCSPPQRDVNHISDEDASPERLLHRRQVFNATGWDPIYDNNTACPGSRWPIQVVMTYNAPPFVFINETSDGTLSYSGISMDVLEELAKNVGFCYTLVSKPGYRATAVINEVLNTSTPVNFGIGSITITAERFARNVYFSEPHYSLALQILIRKQDNSSPWFAFLFVFSWDLWGMLLLTALVFGVSLFLFERHTNESQFTYDNVPQNGALSLYYTTEYMFLAGSMRPETGAGRTLLVGLLILTLAISAGYTAQLTSILTQQAFMMPLEDVDNNGIIDQTDLMSQSADICIAANTAVEEYYNAEISNEYIRGGNASECMAAVLNGSALATVYDAPLIEYYAQLHPQLEVIGRQMNKQSYGIAVSPRAPDLALALSIELMNMQQNGRLMTITSDWLPVVPLADEGMIAQLTPNEFIGLYIIMAALYLLAWAIFLTQEYKLGWLSFDTKNWKKLKYSEASREDRELLLQELKEHGKLPTISLYERLLLQILLELTLNEKAETRQEVADRLEAEESERQMNELGNRLSTMLSKRSTRGADLESTKSVSSEGSNRLSIMLSRLHSRSSRDTENDGGETVEPVRHGRAESPDSGAPLESEVNRKDGV